MSNPPAPSFPHYSILSRRGMEQNSNFTANLYSLRYSFPRTTASFVLTFYQLNELAADVINLTFDRAFHVPEHNRADFFIRRKGLKIFQFAGIHHARFKPSVSLQAHECQP